MFIKTDINRIYIHQAHTGTYFDNNIRWTILTGIIVNGVQCIFEIDFYFYFTSRKCFFTIMLSQKCNSIISTNVREQLLCNLSVFLRYCSIVFKFWQYFVNKILTIRARATNVVQFKVLISKILFFKLDYRPSPFSKSETVHIYWFMACYKTISQPIFYTDIYAYNKWEGLIISIRSIS